MRKRMFSIGAAVAVLTLVSSIASAYVLLSPVRRWFPADLPRLVHVDNRGISSINDPDRGVTSALGAVKAWNGGSVNVVDAVADTFVYKLGDGRSDLVFGDPLSICTGTCLAATTTGYYDSGQKGCCGSTEMVRWTDADIAYNLAYDWTSTRASNPCSGEIYVETVTTHEVGHLIGLGHSNLSSAIMYASVSYCVNKALSSDDLAGRDALYACNFTLGPCAVTCKPKFASCSSNSECCSLICKPNRTCR